MKKLIFLFSLSMAVTTAVKAQSEKYTKAMQDKISIIDTSRNPEVLRDASAAFERIADAEKTHWLPYYYAALAQVNIGYTYGMGNLKPEQGDPIADKAEQLLNKAEELSKDNSEIFVVKKMIASLRMIADPMSRFMTYGPQAEEALNTARKLDANNPRPYLLQAQDKYFTPEQYGGSKEEAKKLFEEALKKYDAFKPASSLHPTWGRGTTQYFLGQMK